MYVHTPGGVPMSKNLWGTFLGGYVIVIIVNKASLFGYMKHAQCSEIIASNSECIKEIIVDKICFIHNKLGVSFNQK